MSKPKHKSTLNPIDELLLLRMEARAMRDVTVESFNAIIDRITQMLPAMEEDEKSRRFKRFTKEDWRKYLTF